MTKVGSPRALLSFKKGRERGNWKQCMASDRIMHDRAYDSREANAAQQFQLTSMHRGSELYVLLFFFFTIKHVTML